MDSNLNQPEITPKFNELAPLIIKEVKNKVSKAKQSEKANNQDGEFKEHSEILEGLKGQLIKLDFKELAFPESVELIERLKKIDSESDQAIDIRKKLDRMKITTKHYLILSIDNLIKVAEINDWGLSVKNGFIYVYNGTYWKEIGKEGFQKFLGEAALIMGVDFFSSRWYRFRDDLFKQFLSEAYLPSPVADKNTVLINLKNGTYEIKADKGSHELRPFQRGDFMTYQLPFDYDPSAKAPMFQAYLDRVQPDKERQDILAEYLGYVFIRNESNVLKAEKALILYGTGANGKSVFFELVNALLGKENISHFNLQNLTDKEGYYRAKISNKLVNYASEISPNMDTAIFKAIVSGEPIGARHPYGHAFDITDYAKLIFNCNELPKEVEPTNAFFRRFLIVPFEVTIPESEQDRDLHKKIIENELSGVFNWVLEGLNRILKNKRFTESRAVTEAVDRYRLESNSVQLFLNEHCLSQGHELDTQVKLSDVYHKYRNFCLNDGMKPFSKMNFSKQLKNMNYQMGRQAGTGQSVFYFLYLPPDERKGISFDPEHPDNWGTLSL